MDVLHAACAEVFFGLFDAAGDFIGAFDVVHFDVHDAQTDADLRIEPFQRIEVGFRPMGEFEHEVIGTQIVQKGDQSGPFAFLDGLAAVVAKTEVHCFAAFHGIEHAIDACGGNRGIGRVSGDVRFIDLHAVAVEFGGLFGQSISDGHVQRVEVVVVGVQQRAGEHVGAGEREFEGTTGDFFRPRAVFRQIEHAFVDGAAHDGGGLAAKGHFMLRTEGSGVRTADTLVDATELVDEVFDHAVRVGMIDVEAVKLAIRRQVDARLALQIENDARGVDERLLAGQRAEPFRDGIGADGGGVDHGGV